MSRTIIKFQDAGDDLHFFTLESPEISVHGVDPGKLHRLTCQVDAEPFTHLGSDNLPTGAIAQIGSALFDQLAENQLVKAALEKALQEGIADPPRPVYLKIGTIETDPDALPWEAMCISDDGTFLALDDAFPIGRIANVASNPIAAERTFDPPLRILAAIGAVGVSGAPEWDALYREIKDAAPSFGYKIRVLVGESDLKATIEAAQAADPGLEVEFLSDKNLKKAVQDFRPHILHFFCHGTVVGKAPMLQLGTNNDFDAGEDEGSLRLEEADFRTFVRSDPSAWLVMLNCCLGAASDAETRSLVSSCVNAGFPAAIGMREPVLNNDAHDFCRFFYRSMLDKLGDVLTDDRERLEVEWAPLLAEARRQLCKKRGGSISSAGDTKEWMLPVLYIRPETFALVGPFIDPELSGEDVARLQAELGELQTHRASLVKEGAPADVLAELDARIESQRAELLPKKSDGD